MSNLPQTDSTNSPIIFKRKEKKLKSILKKQKSFDNIKKKDSNTSFNISHMKTNNALAKTVKFPTKNDAVPMTKIYVINNENTIIKTTSKNTDKTREGCCSCIIF